MSEVEENKAPELDEKDEQLVFDFENAKAKIFRERQDELQLAIGEFAGPLDLLLYLIRREQANIFDIPIAMITERVSPLHQIDGKTRHHSRGRILSDGGDTYRDQNQDALAAGARRRRRRRTC